MSNPERTGDTEQSFLSHLLELRSRLLKAEGKAAVDYAFHMIATDVASPFFAPLKLAFFVAVFLAMPFILFQLWSFVSPGLYRHERRLAIPLLASSVTCRS